MFEPVHALCRCEVFASSPVLSNTLQVFLEARPQTGESVKMLTDEVSQIQEVSVLTDRAYLPNAYLENESTLSGK